MRFWVKFETGVEFEVVPETGTIEEVIEKMKDIGIPFIISKVLPLESKKVYVITGVDLGWDCIVGVYKTLDLILEVFQSLEDESETGDTVTMENILDSRWMHRKGYFLHEETVYGG